MRSDHDLQFPEVLEFRREEGEIRLHEQRVLLVSAAAIGMLRRELIATVGIETARQLLLRFGYANGYDDAISLKAQFQWDDPLDGIRLGPMLHSLEGVVHAELVRLNADPDSHRFEAEALWRHSYEVEQHLHHCGTAKEPACWTLVGYASGFASACLGREIYFRETQCAAV